MTGLTYPDGSVVARTYTNRNQLAQVDYNTALAASFIYDAGRRETSRTFGNNLTTTRAYRADNLTASIDTPTVTSFAYTYDANKNKTAETIGGAMSGYGFSTGPTGYDSENRLTTFNRTDGAMNQSWNLSPVGDWTSFTQNAVAQSRTHGPTHELTAIDSVALTYDSKGNLTTNSNTQNYSWDFDNRLSSAIVPAASPGIEGTHTYTYDALGRRVGKNNGTTNTIYVLTRQQVVSEYASGATPASPTEKYVYASYIDEPILKDGTGGVVYYHRNAQYSIAALTSPASVVVERYAYDAYGKLSVFDSTGVSRPASSFNNAYTYTGRRFDSETELYFFRARYYSTSIGRFIARDPLTYVDGQSLYSAYFAPSHIDPFGLQDLWWWWYYNKNGKALNVNNYPQLIKKLNSDPLTQQAIKNANAKIFAKALSDAFSRKKCPDNISGKGDVNLIKFTATYPVTAKVEYAGNDAETVGGGVIEVLGGATVGPLDIGSTTLYVLGTSTWKATATCTVTITCSCHDGINTMKEVCVDCGKVKYKLTDAFKDPLDLIGIEILEGELPGGVVYNITASLISKKPLSACMSIRDKYDEHADGSAGGG